MKDYVPLEIRYLLKVHNRERRRQDALVDLVAIPLFIVAYAIWELVF